VPASDQLTRVLALRFGGQSSTEARYHATMYYLASGLWLLGAGREAVAVLTDVLASVSDEHGRPGVVGSCDESSTAQRVASA
jgi:hypothetical protein